MAANDELELSISRRGFLLGASGLTAALLLKNENALAAVPKASTPVSGGVLKGFIVSDAHLGWKDERQPKPEEQAEAMRRILKNIPDLDVMIDTGDAHHNYAVLSDLGNWTDVIAGECGTLPMYYVAGNHEIGHNTDCDRELRSNKLGSVGCRPYYSFDIKGIHFVSLPEMLGANLVTNESLDWVELDMAANPGKTTIFLSHNSIANTTLAHDDRGYRQLANSEKVFDFINRYPNAVGWMHGHNHTWEIVQKRGKFYVSNGRIGGFYPSEEFGGNRIGGIYFEVRPDRVIVRGWSANEEKFFDEISSDYAWLTQTIRVPTSLDIKAPAAVSYGAGGVKDGEKMFFAHHHTGAAKSELFISGVREKVFNENSEMAYYGVRPSGSRMLPAVQVAMRKRDDKENWEWIFPGLRLFPSEKPHDTVTVCIPDAGEAKNSYYRCSPGKRYRTLLDLKSQDGGQDVTLQCKIYTSNQEEVFVLDSQVWNLRPGFQTLEAAFDIPDLKDRKSIYTDGSVDDNYQIGIFAIIKNHTSTIEIRRFELMMDGAGDKTVDPAVTIDGKRFAVNGVLSHDQIKQFQLSPFGGNRSVAEFEAKGNGRLTWLVRQTAVAWQVRNAAAYERDGWIEVGPMRNTFSPREEIVIVPKTTVTAPYVHRLRHVNGAGISQPKSANQPVKIEIKALSAQSAEIDVIMNKKPTSVTGADSWDYQPGKLLIKIGKPGTIVITG